MVICAYTFEVGKYLAWVATRADWHAQLRSQIEEALQSTDPPRRILVVDDVIHEGSTILMTTEMLYRLYPQAETCFLGIGSLFSSEYGDYMLKNFPKVTALFPDGAVPPDERPHLIRVAIGSEDITEDSLDWRPISVDSPSVQVLSKYLPASEWVEFSQSVFASIADYIKAQSGSYEPGEPEPEYLPFRFKKEWYILRDVWLENRITRRQIEARFGLSTWKTRKILKLLLKYGDLTIEGRGRSTHYVISEALREHYSIKLDRTNG